MREISSALPNRSFDRYSLARLILQECVRKKPSFSGNKLGFVASWSSLLQTRRA